MSGLFESLAIMWLAIIILGMVGSCIGVSQAVTNQATTPIEENIKKSEDKFKQLEDKVKFLEDKIEKLQEN